MKDLIVSAILLSLGTLSGTLLAQGSGSPDPRDGVFQSGFPYESKFVTINGHRIHYIGHGIVDWHRRNF